MPRKDRLLPPVAIKITDYDAEYMETYHKKSYKAFLSMRQHIKTEYNLRATKKVINNKTYYESYNLKWNTHEGSNGRELLRWHGMADEDIQQITNFNNSEDLKWLNISWNKRKLYDSAFFLAIEPEQSQLEGKRYGTYTADATEANLVQPIPLTQEQQGAWDIFWGLELVDIIDINGEFAIEINEVRKQAVIDANVTRSFFSSSLGLQASSTDPGDSERVHAGISLLNDADATLFYMDVPEEYVSSLGYLIFKRKTLLSKTAFEECSQDNFFDVYASNIFIDWKVDEDWWEKFIGGIIKLVGAILNFILDVLLNIPIVGDIIEWVIEGIASIFNMTFEEARAVFIQVLVAIVALNLTVVSGGFSYFGYVEWISSAWSIGGIAGELAAMTYEDETPQIADEELKNSIRDIEKVQTELSLAIGIEEPWIRLNRPEEELKVDGDNNSTYNIFRLD